MKRYSKEFFSRIEESAERSAREVVPLVLDLLRPKSVIDVGCGTGNWLAVFRDLGVEDAWGVDGSYVPKEGRQIPPDRFLERDLGKPLMLDRRFDLVVSLEVAEHLPASAAPTFVQSLVGLGPVVLFSAAIPFQGGVHHVNEQWPDYWAELFGRHSYVALDCLRKRIWSNDKVQWWYAQNILLFVHTDYTEGHPALRRELERATGTQLAIVHPRKYLALADLRNVSLRNYLANFPRVFVYGLKRTLENLGRGKMGSGNGK